MIDKNELLKFAAEARAIKQQLQADRDNYQSLLNERHALNERIMTAEKKSSPFCNPYFDIERQIIEHVLGDDFHKEKNND